MLKDKYIKYKIYNGFERMNNPTRDNKIANDILPQKDNFLFKNHSRNPSFFPCLLYL